MTSFVRGACASTSLGFALFLAGCGGGGGGGVTVPTATPTTTATATPTPTAGGAITSNQLVFVSTRTGNTELFKANADGTSPTQLTTIGRTNGLNIQKPSVSPNGQLIVFQYGTASPLPPSGSTNNNSTANYEIGIINVNGTGFQSLTNDTQASNRPDDYNPVFSPDGSFIYWTSKGAALNASGATTTGVPHIFRMSVSGANKTQLIREESQFPSVDRSGSTLAYAATDPSMTAPITLFNLSSNTVSKRIGSGIAPRSVFNLALSPDASRVAFSSTTSTGNSQINILNTSNGTTAATIAAGNLFNGGETWSNDSSTLYFDALIAPNTKLQLFSLPAPFTATPHQLTTDAQGSNYSAARVTGS